MVAASPQEQFVRAASAAPCSKTAREAAAGPAAAPASGGGCPVGGDNGSQQAASTGRECPVISDELDPRTFLPSARALAADAAPEGLGSDRAASTIPVAEEGELPLHQRAGTRTWLYPSERMFFSAMRRKGWDPQAEDMPVVLQLHNTVNERAWQQVMQWERLHAAACGSPKLKRFAGRPKDLSPKARYLTLLGYRPPFDRHDWVVDRCGREVRYVIDFYNASPQPDAAVALHLDVRPALDSPGALWDRARMQARRLRQGRWALA